MTRPLSGGGSPDEFFAGCPEGLALFRAVEDAVATIGEAEVRVTKSQIAFRRRNAFAFVWRPDQYVSSVVPAVLSIALSRRLSSERFKEVVHPAPTVWMHHIELGGVAEIDDEVCEWLGVAYENAK